MSTSKSGSETTAEQRMNQIMNMTVSSFPEAVVDELEFSPASYSMVDGKMTYNPHWTVGIDLFGQILRGKLGNQNPPPETILTIVACEGKDKDCLATDGGGARRVRLYGLDEVRNYCRSGILSTDAETERKTTLNKVDMEEYGLRINYRTERPLMGSEREDLIKYIQKKDTKKYFRYAERYTVPLREDLGATGRGRVQLDFTVVRSGIGMNLTGANILGRSANVDERYEIELDATGLTAADLKEGTPTRTYISDVLKNILLQIHGGITLRQASVTLAGLKGYTGLCNRLWGIKPITDECDVRQSGRQKPGASAGTAPVVNLEDVLVDLSPATMAAVASYFVAPNINTLGRTEHVKSGIMLNPKSGTDTFVTIRSINRAKGSKGVGIAAKGASTAPADTVDLDIYMGKTVISAIGLPLTSADADADADDKANSLDQYVQAHQPNSTITVPTDLLLSV